MKVAIVKDEVETKPFGSIGPGDLFTDPEDSDSPLYIKTDEGEAIMLLTGFTQEGFEPNYGVVDVTEKYVIVNL